MAGYQKGIKCLVQQMAKHLRTNVSGTLQLRSVNTIVYQNGSNDKLFIGTDIGVLHN